MNEKTKAILVWIGVLLTFFFTVYPEPFFKHLGVDSKYKEELIRIFTGTNAIILAFLSNTGLQIARKNAASKSATSSYDFLLSKQVENSPFKSIAIYIGPHSSLSVSHLESLMKRAAILGNLKPVVVSSIRSLEEAVSDVNCVGALTHSTRYEDAIPCTAQKNKTLCCVRNDKKQLRKGAGQRIDILMDLDSHKNEELFFLAEQLSQIFYLDTPRWAGVQGNWVGTYGLVSLKQLADMSVDGVYWYGHGKINGTCMIDEERERLIFEFKWNQQNNEGGFASKNSGSGFFILPAGFEFMLGVWGLASDLEARQIWCLTRVSADLITEIKNNNGNRDFGLSQHDIINLI